MIVSLSQALTIEQPSCLSSATKLSPSYDQAIDKAIDRGATRDPAIGQGNGMAGSYETVRLNGGTYQIWTGNVVYELNKGKRRPGF